MKEPKDRPVKLLKAGVAFKTLQGDRVADVYLAPRRGSYSVATPYYKYQGRWITPFEQRIRGWKPVNYWDVSGPIFNLVAKEVYKDSIADLIPDSINLFNRIGMIENNCKPVVLKLDK